MYVRGRRRSPALAHASLGDVVRPTDSVAVNAAASDPVAVQVWRDKVNKTGGLAVRLKLDPKAIYSQQGNTPGILYAKYANPAGSAKPYRYEIAPVFVQLADGRRATADETRIAAVRLLEATQRGAQAVLSAPVNIVSAVTGIPRGLVPWLLVAGAAAFVYSKVK